MKAKEVLYKTVDPSWGTYLSVELENKMVEAMEAYANLQIEQLKNDFLYQLTNKNAEIRDLQNELYVAKDLNNALNYQAMAMQKTYEFMLKTVAQEAWNAVSDVNMPIDLTFEKWYGNRQLTVGDV
jgi:hypothetical protein